MSAPRTSESLSVAYNGLEEMEPSPKIAICFAKVLLVGRVREPFHSEVLDDQGKRHPLRTAHRLIAVVLRRVPATDDPAAVLHRIQGRFKHGAKLVPGIGTAWTDIEAKGRGMRAIWANYARDGVPAAKGMAPWPVVTPAAQPVVDLPPP